MRIADFLTPARVVPDMTARTKSEALAELADCVARDNPAIPREALLAALEERERLGPSTGLEHGVAIPHAKLKQLSGIVGCLGRSRAGVEFGAQDRQPSHLFVLLAVPEAASFRPLHLKALARVARLLRNADVRSTLESAATADDLWRALAAEDEQAAAL